MIPVYDISSVNVVSTNTIKGNWLMTSHERDVLVALARSIDVHTMIETGVHIGCAAFEILFNVASVQHYVGIDVPKNYVPSMPQQIGEVTDNPGYLVKDNLKFELVIRPRGSLDLRPADLPSCNMFLIDGDHGRQAVLHDTMLARSLVIPGGIILWHDYNEACVVDVKSVIEELVAAGDKIEHIPDTWLAIERR